MDIKEGMNYYPTFLILRETYGMTDSVIYNIILWKIINYIIFKDNSLLNI